MIFDHYVFSLQSIVFNTTTLLRKYISLIAPSPWTLPHAVLNLASVPVDNNFQYRIDTCHLSGDSHATDWLACKHHHVLNLLAIVMMVLQSVSSSSGMTSLISDSLMQKLCGCTSELTIAIILCLGMFWGIGIVKFSTSELTSQKHTQIEFKVVNVKL